MQQKDSTGRRFRFKAMLIFLACTATVGLIVSVLTLFHLFFGDIFTKNEILTVPNLTGSVLTDKLPKGAEHFQIVRIDQYDEAPIGTVLSQSPTAGSKRKSVSGKRYATLTLYVSKGRETAIVPSVAGSSVESAVCELLSRGFSYERIERYDDDVPAGEVVTQSHTAGTILPKGETVTLTVSKGAKNRKVQVPVLSGLSLVEAKSLAEALELRIGRISYRASENEDGQVLAQFPLPGTRAPVGVEISLTLSKNQAETTEELPKGDAKNPSTETTEPNEEETRDLHDEIYELPHKNKEQNQAPVEKNDSTLDRILDRFFENYLPKNSQNQR